MHNRGRQEDGSPNAVDTHVGRRLRQRRVELGISQSKLGDMIGLTFQQVQKYERGANRIGASRLWDLANAMKCQVGYFFEHMPAATTISSPASMVHRGDAPVADDVEVPPTLRAMRLAQRIVRIGSRHAEVISDLVAALEAKPKIDEMVDAMEAVDGAPV